MFHIAFYVPNEHAEKVKEAMFNAGAGKIGNYAKCSFEYSGLGQFETLPGGQPFIGEVGKLEVVPELKIEMVCDDQYIEEVIGALKKTHPYETPAYYVIKTVKI